METPAFHDWAGVGGGEQYNTRGHTTDVTKNTNQRIEICWNEAREKKDILSITFESSAKVVVKEVCSSTLSNRRINLLNWLKMRAQMDRVRSHFIMAVRDNTAELYGLNRCATDEERLQVVRELLEGNKYLFPEAERKEGGVSGILSLEKQDER